MNSAKVKKPPSKLWLRARHFYDVYRGATGPILAGGGQAAALTVFGEHAYRPGAFLLLNAGPAYHDAWRNWRHARALRKEIRVGEAHGDEMKSVKMLRRAAALNVAEGMISKVPLAYSLFVRDPEPTTVWAPTLGGIAATKYWGWALRQRAMEHQLRVRVREGKASIGELQELEANLLNKLNWHRKVYKEHYSEERNELAKQLADIREKMRKVSHK